jgi:hypothetical protein
MLSLIIFNDNCSSYMHTFLFLVNSYVYKACNPKILNLSINYEKIGLGLFDSRLKLFIYAVFGFCYYMCNLFLPVQVYWLYAPCIPDSRQYRITSTKCRINIFVSPDNGHIFGRNM